MSIWTLAKVIEQKVWTDSLFSIYLEADIEPFQAGQFCRLSMEIDAKRVSRPYSFVNAPGQKVYEFIYNHVPEGVLTPELMALKAGDTLEVAKKGAGLFTLKQVQEADTLWLFATGTALGVFLSILRTPEPWQRFKHCVLVHAVRTAAELTHSEVIQAIKERHPEQFRFVPFVSREQTDFALEGRIHQAIDSGALVDRTGLELSPQNSSTMICGNPHMVADMVQLLKDQGFKPSKPTDPGQITIENYWKD